MARKQIIAPIIVPLLLSGLLAQAIVPLARVATTYQALALNLGVEVVGLLTAVFSLLPVFLAVTIGRFNDRGGAGMATVLDASGICLGCVVLWLAQSTLAGLLIGTSLLGIGQTALLSALQFVTSRSSSKAHRDSILGNYMVAMSMGQAVGPLLIGLTPDEGTLLAIPVFGSVLLIVLTIRLNAVVTVRPHSKGSQPIPLRSIAATRGLPWIILVGSICVTAQDLLLAFMPVLGVERGISPAVIGLLLSVRAIAAMLSRVFFGQAVRRLGRMPLILVAATAGSAGLLSLALPLPVWAIGFSLSVVGFGLAITLTSAIALTMVIAPPAARGTALTLRLTINRIVQFSVPLFSGFLLAPLGAAGIFALSGAALMGTAAAWPRRLALSR